MELIVVLVIALIIIGPKKLPGAAKSLGTSMRGFKDSLSGGSDKDELPAATASTAMTVDESALAVKA
ncbi:MAG TPA: twin-arginine translocase TatA/TatE family subunit [Solirubrobacteraceae bacterium]|nr:twin-arginine translocase TatA/TatE family subunit [Solirubrobacteraceae bacterium]